MADRKPWEEESDDEGQAEDFGEHGRRRDDFVGQFSKRRLAGRLSRLAAKFLDGILYLGAGLPGIVLIFVGIGMSNNNSERAPSPLLLVGILLAAIGVLGLLAYQIVLLSNQGQTIGKRMMNVCIVKLEDDSNPGFVHAWLLRDFVIGLIGAVPYIGSLFSLVDILFIFREDHRCIHDLIAGTRVVEA